MAQFDPKAGEIQPTKAIGGNDLKPKVSPPGVFQATVDLQSTTLSPLCLYTVVDNDPVYLRSFARTLTIAVLKDGGSAPTFKLGKRNQAGTLDDDYFFTTVTEADSATLGVAKSTADTVNNIAWATTADTESKRRMTQGESVELTWTASGGGGSPTGKIRVQAQLHYDTVTPVIYGDQA